MDVQMSVDIAEFKSALEELRSGLETPNIFERFDSGLLGDLQEAVNSGAVGELFELSGVPANGAGALCFQMKPSGLLNRSIAAVRALRAEKNADGIGHISSPV